MAPHVPRPPAQIARRALSLQRELCLTGALAVRPVKLILTATLPHLVLCAPPVPSQSQGRFLAHYVKLGRLIQILIQPRSVKIAMLERSPGRVL